MTNLWQLILRPVTLPDMPLGVLFVVLVLAILFIVEPRPRVRR